MDLIQTKQICEGREQRNNYSPRTKTRTTPSNQTRRQAGGFLGYPATQGFLGSCCTWRGALITCFFLVGFFCEPINQNNWITAPNIIHTLDDPKYVILNHLHPLCFLRTSPSLLSISRRRLSNPGETAVRRGPDAARREAGEGRGESRNGTMTMVHLVSTVKALYQLWVSDTTPLMECITASPLF